jgi:hypothetical protein
MINNKLCDDFDEVAEITNTKQVLDLMKREDADAEEEEEEPSRKGRSRKKKGKSKSRKSPLEKHVKDRARTTFPLSPAEVAGSEEPEDE